MLSDITAWIVAIFIIWTTTVLYNNSTPYKTNYDKHWFDYFTKE